MEDTFLTREPLKMGTYPVTLAAGNWHDILTALEWGMQAARKQELLSTLEAFERVHGQVLAQARRDHEPRVEEGSERRCECGAPYDAERGGFTCAR